ncbi:NAD(P)H-dependent oxidoreductase [candidate division KSB1 bacterium]|nr:NAD(P)H-dependent oxidoreductase [candidate division KSB1 bacterium]
MRLTLFNGSPRGKASNSKILLEQFLKGFQENPENRYEIAYLNHTGDQAKFVELFRQAEMVLLIFPLYTDAMPGIVKLFIESLAPLVGRAENPPIGFIIHSGFPEAIHCRALERYLEKLARRLGCPYLGTVIKGGTEGIQIQPPRMTRKLFTAFQQLGRYFAQNRQFDPQIMQQFTKRERFPLIVRGIFTVLAWTGLTNMYWNMQLKKNGAYPSRFDRPYQA